MIIGVTGTLGAGKGTVVECLKQDGFAHYSSSALLGALVEADGNPKTRDFLSPKATELQKEFPGGVVEKNYRERYLADRPEHAVFEAIHRQSEADFIRSVGGAIIGVDAGLEARYARAAARNEGEKDRQGLEDFKKQSHIEDEGGGDASRDNNIRAVLRGADAVVMNDGTLDELRAQLDAALAVLFTRPS